MGPRPEPGHASIHAWAAEQLGSTRGWIRVDSGQGSTAVFELTDADGRAWIVKHYRSARGFEQERAALTRWFAEPSIARVPTVVAAEPSLTTLILERLPGVTGDGGARGEGAVHHAAGQFLAALHRLDMPDDDPLGLAEALARRTRAWSRRADLAPELQRVVDRFGPRPELFEGARRVPCHRDFVPRNWLWDGNALAVIDFEHARMDLALVDFAKLCVGCWRLRPDLAEAFFRGYGRRLSAIERIALRSVVVLHGVASMAWGREHGEPEYVDEGISALAMVDDWAPTW